VVIAEFGESANTLIQKWHGGYRYGFPDFVATGVPVRPMNYDQSRIYQGVVGRHYPDAETARYHYMFDQNMYLQPGISGAADGMTTQTKIAIGVGVLALGAAALAYYQFAHGPTESMRHGRDPAWAPESGRAYRAGRRLRTRRARR
jgi:hypothetical protein